MNWRTTGTLGAAFLVLLVLWMVWKPVRPVIPKDEKVFPPEIWQYEAISKIEVQPLGQPTLVVERRTAAGMAWWITTPIERPAWEPYVSDMVGALRELSKITAVPPGTPGHDLAAAGVDKPDIVVKVHRGEGESKTLKFGRQLQKDPSQRWFLVDDDPNLYFGPQTSFEPFQRSVGEVRHKGVVFVDRHRVWKVALHERYEKIEPTPCAKCRALIGSDGKCLNANCKEPGPVGPRKEVVDSSEFEFVENRSEVKGWYWTQFNGKKLEERLNEARVHQLLGELTSVQASDFVETSDLAKYGLDRPATRYVLHVKEMPKPVAVLVGGQGKRGEKSVTYVQIEDSGEVAIVESARLSQTPRSRHEFRSVLIFDFERSEVQWIDIRVEGLGRIQIVRYEEPENDQPVEKWKVEHPPGLLVKKEDLEDFARALLGTLRIKDKDGFIGEQPDLKLYGVDPAAPMAVMTIQLKRKSGALDQAVYRLGCKIGGGDTYLTRPGSPEVFAAHPDAWRRIERLDLNFRDRAMFDVSPDDLRKISVQMADDIGGPPTYYQVTRQQDGSWKFSSTEHLGKPVDEDKLKSVLSLLNFIPAQEFMTRRPEKYADLGFPGQQSACRIEIDYETKGRKDTCVFKISKPHTSEGIRYAMIQGDPIVFRYERKFVDTLRAGVEKK